MLTGSPARAGSKNRLCFRIPAFAAALLGLALACPAPGARADVLDSLSPDNEVISAIEDKDREKFQLAIVKDIRPTVRDALGVPAIIVAVESKDPFFVERLLEMGARPDDRPRKREDDRTALTRAAELGETAMVRTLLEHGADPNLPGEQNEPALIKAAHAGYPFVVRLLVDHGADLMATEMTGRTAMEVAERSGNYQIVDMLRDAGAEY